MTSQISLIVMPWIFFNTSMHNCENGCIGNSYFLLLMKTMNFGH
jgi:hypothetical protein